MSGQLYAPAPLPSKGRLAPTEQEAESPQIQYGLSLEIDKFCCPLIPVNVFCFLNAYRVDVQNVRRFNSTSSQAFLAWSLTKDKDHCYMYIAHNLNCGPGSSVGIATELLAGRTGDRILVGRGFPPVQTGPEAHTTSCTMGTGFSRGQNTAGACC